MYMRCSDQGTKFEVPVHTIKSLETYNEDGYVQIKITSNQGQVGFADKIWFSKESIFDFKG